ncbi:MAG: glycosyltransferase, partial [Acidobacteriota bacterium]
MKVVIAGGGTGGHFFPGLAVAQALKERRPETRVVFVGGRRGIEC